MGRPPGAKNKPRTTTAERDAAPDMADQATSKGEVAIFQPPRLPYDHRIEDKFGVDVGQWKVLVEAIYPSAKTVDAIVMALNYCKSRKLDPFKRPVHIVPMWDSQRGAMVETVWPGISELRTTASRTKGYAGIDAADFGDDETTDFEGRVQEYENGQRKWLTKKVTVTHPAWCRMTVYRIIDGQRCKFVGPKVAWLETYATLGKTELPNAMWQNRPEGQLEKCAEAAALRRAFPEEIGNDLTAEEMIGRDIHSVAGEIEHVHTEAAPETAAQRDTAPPRTAPTAQQQPEPELEVDDEARDGTPPPRPAKPQALPPKEDPISSGPPRQISAPKQEGPAHETTPHRVPGDGHTFDSWAERYCELIQTSEDTATLMKWIDVNSRKFMHKGPNGQEVEVDGPLVRLEQKSPTTYAKVRKVTEKVQTALRDAQKKASDKEAKKAATKAAAPSNMMDDDGPAPGQYEESLRTPANPDAILKQIDAELAAVEDPEQLDEVWNGACKVLLDKLDFPPDVDEAQALFDKHSRRLGGD